MGSLVVTHPFHPLCGQDLPILLRKRRSGVVVFVCEGGPLGRVTLRAEWTDRGGQPQSQRLSAQALAELDALTRCWASCWVALAPSGLVSLAGRWG